MLTQKLYLRDSGLSNPNFSHDKVAATSERCYKTFLGGNLDFSDIWKAMIACSGVRTSTKTAKHCNFSRKSKRLLLKCPFVVIPVLIH